MQAELSLYDHTVIAIQGFVMGVVLSHVFCDKHSPLTPLQVPAGKRNTSIDRGAAPGGKDVPRHSWAVLNTQHSAETTI
ncbi:hypothetical protein KUCAC02_001145 [Chaenocephalus aceratus]|uniref:Uncharacterized protein n=1 Tax=Chaenocephalus aceratus TaxID=36190 RepID=A0ACB9XXQ8_CHAAC|nr:hypothetical protein KUCAC02_001145 [Chaenocephalus aceratus]